MRDLEHRRFISHQSKWVWLIISLGWDRPSGTLGQMQKDQSTLGGVWAVTSRKSITDKYLQQDMDPAGCFSGHPNCPFYQRQTLSSTAGSGSVDDALQCKVGRWLLWPPPKWTRPSQNGSLGVCFLTVCQNSNSALRNYADFDVKLTKWIMWWIIW